MNSLISIVIPYYDHSSYLRQAVESALAQTYTNLEVIVVDDCSPLVDARELLADLVAKSCGKLSIIRRDTNGGSAASKNTAVMQSKGEFILPLDSDDFLDSEYAQVAMDALNDFEGISGVYTQTQLLGLQDFVHAPECTIIDILSGKPAPTTFLYSRKMFDALGGYNTSVYHDDDEFWLRALSRNHKFLRVDKPLYHYRKHGRGKSDVNRAAALASFAKEHPDLYGKHLPVVLERLEQKYFDISDEYQTLHDAFKELTEYHKDLEKRYAELARQNEQLSKRISLRVFEKVKASLKNPTAR
jgi:glycosyltransferase involved in cell wall biosynthesis